MSGKKPAEYKGIAKFFSFLSGPEVQAEWHQQTGYLPLTMASYDLTKRAASTTRTRAPTFRSSR
jgi:sn-glycerol 3-phosphate transport system substrate-binding protein